MRLSCASKASSDLPKATNTSPARAASAQGIERRSTKASGEKLSCAVRFTCAEGGALPSSLLSLLRRPRALYWSLRVLPGGEARASESRPLVPHDRGLGGFLSLRVLGAVLVPGQVEPAAVLECV